MIDLLTLQFLEGPAFLVFYGSLTVLCHFLAARLTAKLKEVSSGRTSSIPLTTYHLALLQGDKQRALLSALVRLEAAGAVQVDTQAKPPKVVRLQDLRLEDGLEAAVLSQLRQPRSLAELSKGSSVETRLNDLEDELYAQDLLVPKEAVAANWGRLNWIFGPLLGLGLARLVVGMSLGRPVGFLFCVLVLSYLASFRHPPKRNRRGEKLLQDHQSRCAALKSTAESAAKNQLGSQDLSLAMALFGTSALATLLMPAPSSGGGCGSSCGSSCGGGCGGGCGGCGG